MTEQEIIEVLKENKKKGVAYLFLHEDVRDWILENFRDPKLMYLVPDGKWESFSETGFDDFDNVVFALPEYYQEESNGEWVEFEIESYKDKAYRFSADNRVFNWFDWQYFLQYSLECNLGFTAFGGWQYNGSDWNTYPLIQCGEKASSGVSFSIDDKPMIPKKIRFWRENELFCRHNCKMF